MTDKALPQDAEAVENAYGKWKEERGYLLLPFYTKLSEHRIALAAFKAGWYAHKRQEPSKMEQNDGRT